MIKANRITLKLLEPKDMPAVLEIYQDKKATKYLIQSSANLTVDNIGAMLIETQSGTLSLPFGMFLTGELIGVIVASNIDLVNRSACIKHFVVNPKFWRDGYGGEGAYHFVSHLFLERNLRRIYAYSIAGNFGMEEIFRRCGFRHEGTAVKEMFYGGEYVDTKNWAVFKDEFNWGVRKEANWYLGE